MDHGDGLQSIRRLTPRKGERIDWARIGGSFLSPILEQMAQTRQNPRYHGEIDVLSHTKMVCEELVKLPEYQKGSETDQTVLFWAALLHDIGKTVCTAEYDGELRSPHHASKGSVMARALLWQELGLCGSVEKQRIRESICNLIRYHSFPPYALSCENADYRLLKIAANGELASLFSIEKLCVLEKADVLGRISAGRADDLERIEYCKALAQELGCWKTPYGFADDYSKRAYFQGKTAWKEQAMFRDAWGTVILLSGLPGTGKDTYVKEHYANLPMISLDELRKKHNIPHTANQGRVAAIGHEIAREYLRKKQPFVWNATNISTQTREKQITLFENYGASVETVFLETEWSEELRRNQSREARVPENVIRSMLSKLVPPERYESETVLWRSV